MRTTQFAYTESIYTANCSNCSNKCLSSCSGACLGNCGDACGGTTGYYK